MKRIFRNTSKKILALLVLVVVVITGSVIASAEGEEENQLKIIGLKEAHKIGSSDDIIIVCTGKIDDFVSLSIDDKTIDTSNYIVEKYGLGEGSTLLKIKSDYLEMLYEDENYKYEQLFAGEKEYKGAINYTNTSINFNFYIYMSYHSFYNIQSQENEEFIDIQKENDTIILKLSGKLGTAADLEEFYYGKILLNKSEYILEEKDNSVFLTFKTNELKSSLELYYYNRTIHVLKNTQFENTQDDTIIKVNVTSSHFFSPNCIIKGDYYGMTEVSTGLSSDQIINISIDGNILDKSLYTINGQENTTNTIAFDLDYMKTLSIGRHIISADYIDKNNKNEVATTTFKIEEPLKFPQSSNQCSPECQAQIDDLKSQVKSLQEQLISLQSQVAQLQGNTNSGDNNNNNNSNNNNDGTNGNNIPTVPDNSNSNNDNTQNDTSNDNNINNSDNNNAGNDNNNNNNNTGNNNSSTTDNLISNGGNSIDTSNNNAKGTQTNTSSITPSGSNTTNTNVPVANSSNEVNASNKSVKTGDELKIFLIGFVFLCSACGVIICVRNIKNVMK